MAQVLLQYEVEQFLYHEAALLDDRRFHEWLELRPILSASRRVHLGLKKWALAEKFPA